MEQALKFIVKLVQVPAQLRTNGRPSVGYGEAGLYASKLQRQAQQDLSRVVADHGGLGALVPSVLSFDNGKAAVLDAEYTHLVFVPARARIMDDTFAPKVFYPALDAVLKDLAAKAAAGAEVGLTLSTPGTFENPSNADTKERHANVEALAATHGVPVTFRFAPRDLPRDAQVANIDVSEDITAVMDDETMLFIGARSLERNSAQRIAALRAIVGVLLDEMQPTHVVTTLAVGANLAMAEVAVERGIAVTLVQSNSTENWAPATLERLQAVLDRTDLVEVTGKGEYQRGRIQSTVRYLDQLATQGNALKVAIDDPMGSEARELKNAKNFWPQALAFLRQVDGTNLPEAPTSAPAAPAPASATPADLPF